LKVNVLYCVPSYRVALIYEAVGIRISKDGD